MPSALFSTVSQSTAVRGIASINCRHGGGRPAGFRAPCKVFAVPAHALLCLRLGYLRFDFSAEIKSLYYNGVILSTQRSGMAGNFNVNYRYGTFVWFRVK